MAPKREQWDRYRTGLCVAPEAGLTLAVSLMGYDEAIFERLGPAVELSAIHISEPPRPY